MSLQNIAQKPVETDNNLSAYKTEIEREIKSYESKNNLLITVYLAALGILFSIFIGFYFYFTSEMHAYDKQIYGIQLQISDIRYRSNK